MAGTLLASATAWIPAARATTLHYEQRRPETSPLYRLVARDLETFLAEARAAHEPGVPRYVERELRAYLACGIHAHGFLRARCPSCRKDMLVAFSCKLRGVCPSCNARRMCSTAAHLPDRVFPDVPIRQWVLSVPFELRLLLAKNAAALSAVGRIFVREIWRWQRDCCQRAGEAARESDGLAPRWTWATASFSSTPSRVGPCQIAAGAPVCRAARPSG